MDLYETLAIRHKVLQSKQDKLHILGSDYQLSCSKCDALWRLLEEVRCQRTISEGIIGALKLHENWLKGTWNFQTTWRSLEVCFCFAWNQLEDRSRRAMFVPCSWTDRATPWAPVGAKKRKLMSSLCEILPCSKYSDIFYFRIFADSVFIEKLPGDESSWVEFSCTQILSSILNISVLRKYLKY